MVIVDYFLYSHLTCLCVLIWKNDMRATLENEKLKWTEYTFVPSVSSRGNGYEQVSDSQVWCKESLILFLCTKLDRSLTFPATISDQPKTEHMNLPSLHHRQTKYSPIPEGLYRGFRDTRGCNADQNVPRCKTFQQNSTSIPMKKLQSDWLSSCTLSAN